MYFYILLVLKLFYSFWSCIGMFLLDNNNTLINNLGRFLNVASEPKTQLVFAPHHLKPHFWLKFWFILMFYKNGTLVLTTPCYTCTILSA